MPICSGPDPSESGDATFHHSRIDTLPGEVRLKNPAFSSSTRLTQLLTPVLTGARFSHLQLSFDNAFNVIFLQFFRDL
jgi:hypothetical protein